VNARISHVFAVVAVLLVSLIATVSYWQVWAAPSLAARQTNARLVYRELTIDRGRILAADGTVLARNRARKTRNGSTTYARTYPTGRDASAVVGYSTLGFSRAGIEQSQNDFLTGATSSLSQGLTNIFDKTLGTTVHGNSVRLTLDLKAQRAARAALVASGRPGAVAALDTTTGKVLVLASNPTLDPNSDLSAQFGKAGGAALNRATQGRYPPGSTFKVVTAAAALDARVVDAGTRFPGTRCIKAASRPLCNFHGETPGPHTFSQALVHSYNTTFGQIGITLGGGALRREMTSFGFGQRFPTDSPADEESTAGLYDGSRPLAPNALIDAGRTAIGQGRLLVTPIQMAMVAQGIANGGVVLQPQLVDEVRTPAGGLVQRTQPKPLGRAMTAATAATLTQIMRQVVDEGTGSSLRLPGLSIAGKTGTAEVGDGTNDAWMIAFSPVDAPKVAIAAVIEGTDQTGNQAAGPVVGAVLSALVARAQ